MRLTSIEPQPFHEQEYWSSGPRGVPRQLSLPFLRARVARGALKGCGGLLIISDTQGREHGPPEPGRLLGVAVAEELELMAELGMIPALDQLGVVLAGDLYDYPDLRKLGGSGEVGPVWDAFEQRCRWVVGVLGNHDLVEHASAHQILDGDEVTRDGLTIGGVSGIVGRPDKPNRKTDADYMGLLKRVLRRSPELVVLHMGPDHPEKGFVGSESVRQTLAEARRFEGLVAFGHCHWPEALLSDGHAQLLNVDGRVVLVTEED